MEDTTPQGDQSPTGINWSQFAKNAMADPSVGEHALQIDAQRQADHDPNTHVGPLVDAGRVPVAAIAQAAQGVVELADMVSGDVIPDGAYDPDNWHLVTKTSNPVTGFAASVGSFMVPFMGLGKAARASGLVRAAGKVPMGKYAMRWALPEAVTAGVFMRSDSENIADMLEDYGPSWAADNSLVSFLSHDEGDGKWEGRAKNILEALTFGQLLGGAIDFGIGPLIQGAKNASGTGFRSSWADSVKRTYQAEDFVKKGLIHPDAASDLGLFYRPVDVPEAELQGPGRTARVQELNDTLTAIGRENPETDTNQIVAMFDSVASRWSKQQNKSVDDFYTEVLGGFKFSGDQLSQAVDGLQQGKYSDFAELMPKDLELPPIPIEIQARKTPLDEKSKEFKALSAEEKAATVQSFFAEEDGWAPLTFNITKKGDLEWDTIPYGFDINPRTGETFTAEEAADREAWVSRMAAHLVADFRADLAKAEGGDDTAKYIMAQALWYRAMTDGVRRDFGGLGDVMFELLAALSPRTQVAPNFRGAAEVLSRWTRGEYNADIKKYDKWSKTKDKKLEAWTKKADKIRNRLLKEEGGQELTEKELDALVESELPKPKFDFNKDFSDMDKALKVVSFRIGPSDASGVDGVQTIKTVHQMVNKRAKKLFSDEGRELLKKYNPELAKQGVFDSVDSMKVDLPQGTQFHIPANYFINTERAMQVMLNMWRQGLRAPKAAAFFANNAGWSDAATIDVWAARRLQNIADRLRSEDGAPILGRIAPKAEVSVSGGIPSDGGILRDEFLRGEVKANAQYGMGQEVFERAAAELGMRADDLQAVVWFQEKQLWAQNGWTNQAGGSFDEWMKVINPRRYVVGLSIATENFDPTAEQMEAAAKPLARKLSRMPGVMAAQVTPSYGKYGDYVEPSFNIEVVASGVSKKPFNEARLLKEVAKMARGAEQESAFVSRVLKDHEVSPNARPQAEVFFKGPVTKEQLYPVQKILQDRLGGGYTVITDPRNGDIIGFRQQYVPEYSGVKGHFQEHLEVFEDQMDDAVAAIWKEHGDNISDASVRAVDTIILGEGGRPYESVLGKPARQPRSSDSTSGADGETSWSGLRIRPGAATADRANGGGRPQLSADRYAALGQDGVPGGDAALARREERRSNRGFGPADIRPPSRRIAHAWHYSRDTRALSGILRKFAGTAGAGTEKQYLIKTDDGLVDPDSAYVSVFLPGSNEEVGAFGSFLHQIVPENGFNLLRIESKLYERLQRKAALAAGQQGSVQSARRLLQRYVVEAGYDGVSWTQAREPWQKLNDPAIKDLEGDRAGRDVAAIYRDIAPEEIRQVIRDDSENYKAGLARQKGLASFPQAQTPFEEVAKGEAAVADARGQISFMEDGKAIIELTSRGDPSTVVHELGHLVRRLMHDIDPEQSAKLSDAFGQKDPRAWSVEAEEQFAQEFEKYLLSGVAPRKGLEEVFNAIKEMMRDVYRALLNQHNIDPEKLPIRDEVRDTMDLIFGDGWTRFDVAKGRPSARPPNMAMPGEARRAVDNQTEGSEGISYSLMDDDRIELVADEFDTLEHAPNSPEVRQSYDALKQSVEAQYDDLEQSGVRVVWTSDPEPYSSVQAMQEDIGRNNRLIVTYRDLADYPEDHPMRSQGGRMTTVISTDKAAPQSPIPAATEVSAKALTHAHLLDAVHAYHGHAVFGRSLEAPGRLLAWQAHNTQVPPEARAALATELLGREAFEGARGSSAPRRAGLMPGWTWKSSRSRPAGQLRQPLERDIMSFIEEGLDPMRAAVQGFVHHINFDRVNTSDGVMQVLSEVAGITQKVIDEHIGAEQANKLLLAEAMDEVGRENAEAFLRGISGKTEAYQGIGRDLVALRILSHGQAKEIYKLALKIREMKAAGQENAAVKAEFASRWKAAEVLDQMRGRIQKSAARATQSGNIVVDDGSPVDIIEVMRSMRDGSETDKVLAGLIESETDEATKGILEAAYGRDGVGDARLDKVIDAIEMAESVGQWNPAKRRRLQNLAKVPTLLEALALEPWRAFILSGIKTFSVNLGSGGGMTALMPVFRGVGSILNRDFDDFHQSWKMYVRLAGAIKDMTHSYAMRVRSGGGGIPGVTRDNPGRIRRGADAVIGKLPRPAQMVLSEQVQPVLKSTAIDARPAFHADTFEHRLPSFAGPAVRKAAPAINALGAAIRTPFRVNQAFEEIWGGLNYSAFIRQKALDAADEAIWKNPDIPDDLKTTQATKFVEDYIANSFDETGQAKSIDGTWAHEDAVRYAQTANFVQDLQGGVAGTIQGARTKHPSSQSLLPFFKAPANLLRDTRRYIPGVGHAQRKLERGRIAREGFEEMRWEKNMRDGQAAMGLAVGSFIAYMALNGRITGGGPQNRIEAARWRETGARPYSLVFGEGEDKVWISYNRLDPFGASIGLIADAVEIIPYIAEPAKRDEIATRVVQSLFSNLGARSYMRSTTDFLKAVSQPDLYGGSYARMMLSTLVPNLVGSSTTTTDEVVRTNRNVVEAIKRRLPGYNQDLPPRRNILGEPITPDGGLVPFLDPFTNISKAASPAAYSKKVSNPVLDEISDLRMSLSLPSAKIAHGAIDLTKYRNAEGQDAHDRYQELIGEIKLGGKSISQQLQDVITSRAYQDLPEAIGDTDLDKTNPRVMLIQRIFRAYRNAAKAQLFSEYPELTDKIEILRMSGMAGQDLGFYE